MKRRFELPVSIAASDDGLPRDIAGKIEEADRLTAEIKTELGRNSIDKGKIMQLRSQEKHIQSEVSDWFFARMLATIENARR